MTSETKLKRQEYYKKNKHLWRERYLNRTSEQIEKDRERNRKVRSDREQWLAKRRKYVQENTDMIMLVSAKARAKRKNLPFNLERSDIVIPTVCPVLGITIARNSKSGPQDSSPTLDRIIPRLGYVKGNVRVISHRANTIKNDATLDELRKVVLDLERLS